MKRSIRMASLGLTVMLFALGCSMTPHTDSPMTGATVVPTDPRAMAYGPSIEAIVRNPEVGDKIRAMFGADWEGGQLAPPGAAAYFTMGGLPRIVRIGGANFIAADGCVSGACEAGRVLLLIREGGSEILARLDEGGFSHYYSYGNVTRTAAQLIADSGWRALRLT